MEKPAQPQQQQSQSQAQPQAQQQGQQQTQQAQQPAQQEQQQQQLLQPQAEQPSQQIVSVGPSFDVVPSFTLEEDAQVGNETALNLYQPPPPQKEATISDLQTTMTAFMATMDQRMNRLENAMYYVQKVVEEQGPLAFELRNILQFIVGSGQNLASLPLQNIANKVHQRGQQQQQQQQPAAAGGQKQAQQQQSSQSQAQQQESQQQPPGLTLRLRDMHTKWFTERVFPPFVVEVVDMSTGQVCRKTDGWRVELHLIDGNGNYMDDKMGDQQTRTVTLKDGAAEVTGLKFTVVSSKNGNFFNIEAEVVEPKWVTSSVQKGRSENIVVLSCRLFHNPKRPIEELSADDQLSKMPGIGRLYAERFAASGVKTIRQLSMIPLGHNGRQVRLDLLNRLRRDKGTMTENKLVEYVEKALDIVRKTNDLQRLESFAAQVAPVVAGREQPPSKRAKSNDGKAVGDQQQHQPLPSPQSTIFNVNVDDFINYTEDASPDVSPGAQTPTTTPFSLSLAATTSNLDNQWLENANKNTRSVSGDDVSVSVSVGDETGASLFETKTSEAAQVKHNVRPVIQYPLHNAIGTNDAVLVTNVVDAMREGHLPLNDENNVGWTPLMLACALGNEAIVGFLCSLPETDAQHQSSVNGTSALHVAACQGHASIIQVLLRQPGVDAGVLNKSHFTPLMVAAVKGHEQAVAILSKIADSYRPKTAPGIGLYHLAALSGSEKVLDLVHSGLRLYAFNDSSDGGDSRYGSLVWGSRDDKSGMPSILHCAAFGGSAAAVRWLLRQKVNPNVINQEGWTPLHFAAYCGNASVVEVLAGKCEVNAKTGQGWTALSLVAMNAKVGKLFVDRVVRALMRAGAEDRVSGIPANLVSVSTGNLKALEALQGCLGTCLNSKSAVHGVGEVSPMELGSFFGNSGDLEALRQRLASAQQQSSQPPQQLSLPAPSQTSTQQFSSSPQLSQEQLSQQQPSQQQPSQQQPPQQQPSQQQPSQHQFTTVSDVAQSIVLQAPPQQTPTTQPQQPPANQIGGLVVPFLD